MLHAACRLQLTKTAQSGKSTVHKDYSHKSVDKMLVSLLLLLTTLSACCWSSTFGEMEVSLEGLGKLRGKLGEARNGQQYHQFLGVPYAESPTGDRR